MKWWRENNFSSLQKVIKINENFFFSFFVFNFKIQDSFSETSILGKKLFSHSPWSYKTKEKRNMQEIASLYNNLNQVSRSKTTFLRKFLTLHAELHLPLWSLIKMSLLKNQLTVLLLFWALQFQIITSETKLKTWNLLLFCD